jgi:uncharacterized membrane protein SpoIIM required for sporulation
MKETEFIRQNKDKWAKDESILHNKNAHPDDLGQAFSEITEDLSFARSFYSYRSVRIYLNRQAQFVYFRISKKNITWLKVKQFWTEELPKAMVDSRKDMNLSFYIFLFGVLLGVVSSVYDPDFARQILGDSYIDETLKNIENGDPMAIYKGMSPIDMFLAITFNNLLVAFKVFIFGIVFSVGSAVMLLYNAVMVGTFQFFFFERGIFAESFLAIWLHGTLEISSIILASGAGLTLGRGLLFPGTLSRFHAFQISAQRGLKIMLGITPLFILASIIESFATRYTEAPNILRIIIILSSLAFIIGYYIWYPWKKEQEGFDPELDAIDLPETVNETTDLHQVKTIGSVFSESFLTIRKMGSRHLLILFFLASSLALYFVYSHRNNDLLPLLGNDWFFYDLKRFFTFYKIQSGRYLLNTLLFTLLIASTLKSFRKVNNEARSIKIPLKISIVLLVFFWHLLFLIQDSTLWFSLFLITPIIFLIIIGVSDSENPPTFKRVLAIISTRFFHYYGLTLLIVGVSIALFMIIYSPLLWFYINVIQENIAISNKAFTYFIALTITGVIAFIFFMMMSLLYTGLSLMYFSNAEYKFAISLKKKIYNIKVKKTAYGLERE